MGSPGPGCLVVILQSTMEKIPLQWNLSVNVAVSDVRGPGPHYKSKGQSEGGTVGDARMTAISHLATPLKFE